MYGLVQSCLRKWIKTEYGEPVWRQLLVLCPDISDETDFLHYTNYPDSKLFSMIAGLTTLLDIPADRIIFEVGYRFFEYALDIGYGSILYSLGSTLEHFLKNMDYLHWYLMSTAFPGILSPSFQPEIVDDGNTIILNYYSRRDGTHDVLKGMLTACARNIYNLAITIENLHESKEYIDNKLLVHIVFKVSQEPIGMPRGTMSAVQRSRMLASSQLTRLTVSDQIRSMMDVSGDLFGEISPYHIIFDSDLRICQTGPALAVRVPETQQPAAAMDSLFMMTWPDLPLTVANLLRFSNLIFQLRLIDSSDERMRRTRARKSRIEWKKKESDDIQSVNEDEDTHLLHLKGSIILLKSDDRGEMVATSGAGSADAVFPLDTGDSTVFVFLGSPIADTLANLDQMALKVADIAPHDSSRELILLKDQRSAEFDVMQQLEKTTAELTATTSALHSEMARTDELLHSMMPRAVADKLKKGETVQETFEEVTILFSDIVTFTQIAAACEPVEIVRLLNSLYTHFDQLTEANEVYKVETIGDAYMVVGGCPNREPDHAVKVANQGLQMIERASQVQVPNKGQSVKIRVGMHTGSVVAGIVGLKMPRYCLFGDTVNTASRMESHSQPERLHISETSYDKLKNLPQYKFEHRGQVSVKGKGLMNTYFVLPSDGAAATTTTDKPTTQSGNTQSDSGTGKAAKPNFMTLESRLCVVM